MIRLSALIALLMTVVAVVGGVGMPQVQAQTFAQTQTSPLGVPVPSTAQPGGPRASPSAEPPGPVMRLWYWVMAEQQRLNRELASAVKEMKNGNMLAGTLMLAFISFAYGVLHAAGPGHGKAIISSYVLANEKTLRRGIFLSFLSSFIQALSAIVVVGVLAILLNATSMEIRATEAWIETISWGFVALVGLWLLSGQVKKLTAPRQLPSEGKLTGEAHSHHHNHAHAPGEACDCDHEPVITRVAVVGPKAHVRLARPVEPVPHVHGPGCHDGCGHAHIPEPAELEGDFTWRKALAIAFSVGIRPCTGAILVLIFSLSQGILLAGIFSTFAMALGTAITVSTLASLALGSRDLAVRLAGAQSKWGDWVANGAGLAGSLLVFLMGATFFVASLKAPAPF